MVRALGFLLIAAGLAVLALDFAAGEQPFRLTALGEWWFWAHPESLQLAQPAVERHVHPVLWARGVQPLLEWPLAVELLALGAVLVALGSLGRRRRRRRARPRR